MTLIKVISVACAAQIIFCSPVWSAVCDCGSVKDIVDRALLERSIRSVQRATGLPRGKVEIKDVTYCNGVLNFEGTAGEDTFQVRVSDKDWKEIEVMVNAIAKRGTQG